MAAPYTISITKGVTSYDYLAGTRIEEENAGPAMLTLVLLATDATSLAQDDQVEVAITDNYDNEAEVTTRLFYVQEKRIGKHVTTVTAIGSEFWLGRRLIKTKADPDDIGQIVKDYVDADGAPITTGGVDTATGRNDRHDADYTTLLALLEKYRQEGYRAFVQYTSALAKEELQFFRESTELAAATREFKYGD